MVAFSPQKRVLPASFAVRKRPRLCATAAAAVVIQRAARRFLAVCGWADPVTREPVPAARRFTLVEAGGATYRFDAPVLGAGLLVSGDFRHPVVRRELLRCEVARLARLCPEPARLPLLASFDFRIPAAAWHAERQSLLFALEDDADGALATLLEADEEEVGGLALQYQATLQNLQDADEATTVAVLDRQLARLSRCWPPTSGAVAALAVAGVAAKDLGADAEAGRPRRHTFLGAWLQATW